MLIPAFNEAQAVARVVRELLGHAPWLEVVVVDDGSTDDTKVEAARAGARVLRHPYNKGNGAAVKTGLRAALGTYILIVDADGQHQPADALRLVNQLAEYDLVVGARAASSQASWSRRLGNAGLNRIASYLTGHHIPDLTSGFRAARRECMLEFVHLFPNGFSTPTTSTMAFVRAGYSVRFEPVVAQQREGTSKIRLGSDGARFALILLKVITIFSPLRLFVPLSVMMFAVGALYGVWTIVTQSHITNSTVLLILGSLIILLMGLVSEQIAAMRAEGRRS